MKICNHCETIHADETRFCSKCGTQLDDFSPYYQPQPTGGKMGFKDAIRVCLKEKYASFEGRAKRSEFWFFQLFIFLVYLGISFAAGILGGIISNGNEKIIETMMIIPCFLAGLALICPSVSVLVRRLHDTGRSGWWYWIQLIPYAGSIVIFIFTLLSSQEHDNEYGPYITYN